MDRTHILYAVGFFLILVAFAGAKLELLRVEDVAGAGTTYIYIREDGQVDPPSANITTSDNVTYTFSDNNLALLVIERGDIIVDGLDYTLEGTGFGKGLTWSHVSNITIQNLEVRGFNWGVEVYNSSNNRFFQVNITANDSYGFYFTRSPNTTISQSRVSNNGGFSYTGGRAIYVSSSSNFTIRMTEISSNAGLEGIGLAYSSDCHIHRNTLSANYLGTRISGCDHNVLYDNNITSSGYAGISIHDSMNNTFYGNRLDNNRYGLSVQGYELAHYLNNITASNRVNGKPIYYLASQHNLTISQSSHPAIGYLALINSTGITVEGHNLTENCQGLLLAYTNGSHVHANRFTDNYDGLMLHNSFNNSISLNTIAENAYRGLYLWDSDGNSAFLNDIANNDYQGLYLSDSSNNTISGNTIAHSEYAIEVDGTDNRFYCNNFVNNTQQVDSYGLPNIWDNGREGNYWSPYNGTDSGHDGIGDTSCEIDANNVDNHPLMGTFTSFNTSLAKRVNVITNSTVESFHYFESNRTIRLQVSNRTIDQPYGFCRVSIPHVSMNVSAIYVLVDDGSEPVLYGNYHVEDNGTHRWIYFAFNHSEVKIDIVPEFRPIIILSAFMMTTLLAAFVYRRTRLCRCCTGQSHH
jgi:parallel beta-helix repeat protein